MKFTLYHISKPNKSANTDLESDYIKRIQKYIAFDFVTIPPLKDTKSYPVNQLRELESNMALKKIENKSVLILLDEKGRQFDSRGFAGYLNQYMVGGHKEVSFLIGGAYGFSDKIRSQASGIISLSRLTFSHQLARLILLEQFYRAFAILNNLPYHHD